MLKITSILVQYEPLSGIRGFSAGTTVAAIIASISERPNGSKRMGTHPQRQAGAAPQEIPRNPTDPI